MAVQIAYESNLVNVAESIRAILDSKGVEGRYALYRHGITGLVLISNVGDEDGTTTTLIADGFQRIYDADEYETKCKEIGDFNELRWTRSFKFLEALCGE